MRLYQMELYKICHRKMLWIIGIVFIAWMGFYFYTEMIATQRTTIEGVDYQGFAAIRQDRALADDFAGILTDDKVKQIIQTYSFPTQVEEYVGWKQVNYLTEFVTDHLSDGQIWDWTDYKLPTHVIPIAETQLGAYVTGGGIPFGYMKGWSRFYEFFDMGTELVMVWLMIAIAPLFTEERQLNMNPLIRTARYGKTEDLWAKTGAAVSLAVMVYASFLAVSLILFQRVFGILNVNVPMGITLDKNSYFVLAAIRIQTFACISSITSLLAVLLTVIISIWISAKSRTTFGAMVTSLLIFGAPILLLIMLSDRLVYILASMLPFLLANHVSLIETWSMYGMHLIFAGLVIVAGIVHTQKSWRNVEVS